MDFGPIRAVKNDTVLSPYLPRLGVRINEDFIYLGDLQYILQGTYHIEEFIYICPSSVGHVTRVLLVQFEGFLENKNGKYASTSDVEVDLSGEAYRHAMKVISLPEYYKKSPSSHLTHAADYIRQRSYTLAGEMIYHTFMRLVDADQRNRFSIHFLETIGDTTLSNESLARQTDQHPILLARALENFTILN